MRPITFNRPLALSVASIALAAVICIWQLPALVVAAFPPDLDMDPTARRIAEYLQSHEEDMATYQARIDGRSAFFRPKPKRAPVRIVERPEEDEPPPPPPPPPPKVYTGPSVAFVVGEEVYFAGGLHLRVGEEAQGVTVVGTDPPWTVTLHQHGKDHEIEIFRRTTPFGSSSGSSRLPPGMTIVNPTELAEKPDEADGDETSN